MIKSQTRIEIRFPSTYFAAITGLITQKRGIIEEINEKSSLTILKVQIPIDEILDLAGEIKSLTAGNGVVKNLNSIG